MSVYYSYVLLIVADHVLGGETFQVTYGDDWTVSVLEFNLLVNNII